MALAKRCDRCGKFYEYYITTDKVNAVGLLKISQNGNIWRQTNQATTFALNA